VLYSPASQLDVFPQQRIDQFTQWHATSLGMLAEDGEHLGVKMDRRRQHRALAMESAAFGVREIVLFDGIRSRRYWRASLRVATRRR